MIDNEIQLLDLEDRYVGISILFGPVQPRTRPTLLPFCRTLSIPILSCPDHVIIFVNNKMIVLNDLHC